MWRKIRALYPEVALAFLMGFALELYFSGKEAQILWEQSFQNVFLLNMTGISTVVINVQTWYVSSMLLCMMILFPLIRKHQDIMVNVVLPLVALLILGGFCINKTSPRDHSKLWMEYTYKGNFRAMAELSIGICLYPLAERLKKIKFSTVGRVLISVVEWTCYISVLEYMRMEVASRRDYYYLLVYALAILLSFSQQGIDTAWFQNRFCAFLGKVSFPLYLAHHCWAKNLNNFLPDGLSNKERFAIYIAVSAAATLLIMGVSALMRKLGSMLKKPVQNLLLAEEAQSVIS